MSQDHHQKYRIETLSPETSENWHPAPRIRRFRQSASSRQLDWNGMEHFGNEIALPAVYIYIIYVYIIDITNLKSLDTIYHILQAYWLNHEVQFHGFFWILGIQVETPRSQRVSRDAFRGWECGIVGKQGGNCYIHVAWPPKNLKRGVNLEWINVTYRIVAGVRLGMSDTCALTPASMLLLMQTDVNWSNRW